MNDPGVQGLAQLGRNAIDRVSELERGIAYRDQMIRQLSEELDDLIKTDNETIRSLFAEQAKRDETVRQLRAQLDEYEREKLKRESQEPVAFRWLGRGKGWLPVYAEPPVPRELDARIRELEAEKAERERQEPILWWDGDKIVSENRKYLFPFVNPPQPLYAHPLALREPTEDECREIRRLAKNEECDGSKVCEGRAMFKAVREVMAK